MQVSEIFKSLQGEGPSVGRPALFLRLTGCNLRCRWCDTPYAQEKGISQPIEVVLKNLKVAGLEKTDYLVITGGEPMLQVEEIQELINNLPLNVKKVGIETNGTTPPGRLTNQEIVSFLDNVRNLVDMEYCVSPKLLNSGSSAGIDQFCQEWVNYVGKDNINFKFVAGTKQDLFEIENFVRLNEIPRERVWLMPECRTSTKHVELMPLLFESAVQYGYNLSPRLHILAYQNKRGV